MILTRPQRISLKRIYQRTQEAQINAHIPISQHTTYRQFRSTVQPGWDCIMVPFAGMWLGIEQDGYTHS